MQYGNVVIKKIILSSLFIMSIYTGAIALNDFPQTEISNGIVKAKLYLPDAQSGYYQSTRFDWSGVIASLDYKGHSYFGEWFKKHDPKRHDGITGPVNEFDAIGYESAKPGDKFLKIGVGVLLRADEKPYSSYVLYEIVNQGVWKINKNKDRVEFTQQLTDESGYGYLYRKTVRLEKGKPELTLDHSLKNTGSLKIDGNVYNHNFFVIDKQLIGPSIKIKFPFEVAGTGRGFGEVGEIRGKEIKYLREFKKNESMYIGVVTGFGKDAKDNDFRIENHKSGAGVRITGDKPISRMVFWSSSTTSCPEPYIKITLNPGETMHWKTMYEFYELAKE